jgi:hypothetical protein
MPALRFGARMRSWKDTRFRPTEGMNGRDPERSACFRIALGLRASAPSLVGSSNRKLNAAACHKVATRSLAGFNGEAPSARSGLRSPEALAFE